MGRGGGVLVAFTLFRGSESRSGGRTKTNNNVNLTTRLAHVRVGAGVEVRSRDAVADGKRDLEGLCGHRRVSLGRASTDTDKHALSMSSGKTQTRPSSPENEVPGGGQAVTVSVVSAPPLLSNLPMAGSTVTHSGASSKPA